MKINNVPDYAYDYKYIVARWVEEEWWFYEAYNDEEKADEVADELINTDVFVSIP
jgi:hypothetical protein